MSNETKTAASFTCSTRISGVTYTETVDAKNKGLASQKFRRILVKEHELPRSRVKEAVVSIESESTATENTDETTKVIDPVETGELKLVDVTVKQNSKNFVSWCYVFVNKRRVELTEKIRAAVAPVIEQKMREHDIGTEIDWNTRQTGQVKFNSRSIAMNIYFTSK